MRLTIIIPTHNRADLCSRLMNKLPIKDDIEVLFIENGSSKEELLRYMKIKLNNNCSLYHMESGNVSAARNFGIERANGNHIYFLDDDDELSPSGLKILSKFQYKKGINKFSFSWNNKDKKINWPFFRSSRQNLSPSTWILPREILINNKIRFNESITYGEDQLFGYRILSLQNKINYRREMLINYNPTGEAFSLTRGSVLSETAKRAVLKELGNDRNGKIIRKKILRNLKNEGKNE